MIPARSNGKHPGGRPSKYHPRYCQKLLAFMRVGGKIIVKPMVVSVGDNGGSEIIDHPLGKLPAFFEGFARKIGVTTQTLCEWGRVHPEFSEAYKKAKEIQLEQMVAGAMSGIYQPAGVIFALKNMHGWRDRQPDESPTVNVHVQVTMIESLKQVAAHRLTPFGEGIPADNGHARS